MANSDINLVYLHNLAKYYVDKLKIIHPDLSPRESDLVEVAYFHGLIKAEVDGQKQ